jgi:hypothetical protein
MIAGQATSRFLQIGFANDIVPLKDRAGFVSGDLYRNLFWNPSPDHIADGRTLESMKDPFRTACLLHGM